MDADWRYWHAVAGNFDYLVARLSTAMERGEELSQAMFVKSHITFDEHHYILAARYPEERIEKLLICLLKRKTRFQRTYRDLAREVDEDVRITLADSLKQLENTPIKPKPRKLTPLFGLDLSTSFRAYFEDINTCETRADRINEEIESRYPPTPIIFDEYGDDNDEFYHHNDNFAIALVSESGGLLRLRDGSTCLSVPAGAFESYPQLIYMYKYHETFSVGTTEYTLPVIHCGPDDLRFDIPATLAFTHNCKNDALITILYRKPTENWINVIPIVSHFVTSSSRFTSTCITETGEYTITDSIHVRRTLMQGIVAPASTLYLPTAAATAAYVTKSSDRPRGPPVSKPHLSADVGTDIIDHDRHGYQLFHSTSDPSMIKIRSGPLSAITNMETMNNWSNVSLHKPFPGVLSALGVSFEVKDTVNCTIENHLVQNSSATQNVDEWIMNVNIDDWSSEIATVDLLIYAKTQDSPIYKSTLIFDLFIDQKPHHGTVAGGFLERVPSGPLKYILTATMGLFETASMRYRRVAGRTGFFHVRRSTDWRRVGYKCKSALLTASMTSSLVIRSAISDIAYVPPLYRDLAWSLVIRKGTKPVVYPFPRGHQEGGNRKALAIIEAYCGMIFHGDARHSIRELMCLVAAALPEPHPRGQFSHTILRSSWKLMNLVPAEDTKTLAGLLLKNGDISVTDRNEINSIKDPILRMMWLLRTILMSDRDSDEVFKDLYRYINLVSFNASSVLIANLPRTQHMAAELSESELKPDTFFDDSKGADNWSSETVSTAVEFDQPATDSWVEQKLLDVGDEVDIKFETRDAESLHDYSMFIQDNTEAEINMDKGQLARDGDFKNLTKLVRRHRARVDVRDGEEDIMTNIVHPSVDLRIERNIIEEKKGSAIKAFDESEKINTEETKEIATEIREGNKRTNIWGSKKSEKQKEISVESDVRDSRAIKEIPETLKIVDWFNDAYTILFRDNVSKKSSTSVALPTFASAYISSENGGLLRLADNSASISIPPGAFKQPVQRLDLFTHHENRHIGGVDRSVRIVQCEPDGMEFDQPICVSYTQKFENDSSKFEIFTRSTKTQGRWQKLDKSECFYTINTVIGLVTMHVMHFSEYMIVPLSADRHNTDSEITGAPTDCLRVYAFERTKPEPGGTTTAFITVCVVNSTKDPSREIRETYQSLGYTMSCSSRYLPEYYVQSDVTVIVTNFDNCRAIGDTQQTITATELASREIPITCNFRLEMTAEDGEARCDVAFVVTGREGPIYGIELCINSQQALVHSVTWSGREGMFFVLEVLFLLITASSYGWQYAIMNVPSSIAMSSVVFLTIVVPLFNHPVCVSITRKALELIKIDKSTITSIFVSADQLDRARVIGLISCTEAIPETIDSLLPYEMKTKIRVYIERDWPIFADCMPKSQIDVELLEAFCRGKTRITPGFCVTDELEQQCVAWQLNKNKTLTHVFEVLLAFSIKTREFGPITDRFWRFREAILKAKRYLIDHCGIPSVPLTLATSMHSNYFISDDELDCIVYVSDTNTDRAKMERLLGQLTAVDKVDVRGIYELIIDKISDISMMEHVVAHLTSKFEDLTCVTESEVVEQIINDIRLRIFSNHLPPFNFDRFMTRYVYSHHSSNEINS